MRSGGSLSRLGRQLVLAGGVGIIAVALVGGLAVPQSHAEKYSGLLRAVLRENPPSLSIHEEATISTVWPVMPMYNNLVLYDWDKPVETVEHLTPELAESWAWSDGGKLLTFKLRRGVTWHDGKPFTSADVKYTFDLVRGLVPGKRLKLNPRKLYYDNVKEIQTEGDFEVRFVLKRPQPSLLSFLASGYSPIYPAHIDPAQLRTKPLGTGPFMLKEYVPDERIVLTRNPHYFVKGRPFLDGIRYLVIKDRQARTVALISGQVDIFFPQEGTPQMRDQVKAQQPDMKLSVVAQSNSYNVILNTKRAPLNNPKVREAINYALNRNDFLKTQHGATVPAGALVPPPYGPWGLSPADMAKLPGWGDGAKDKALARKLLAEAGYGPGHPLKLPVTTRSPAAYQDMAVWMVSELKQVGIDATLEVIETGVWFGKLARRDFLIGANTTGTGPDDPDANFLENYSCGSPRNYSDFCDPKLEAQMTAASEELDPQKRLLDMRDIDRKLQMAGARPMLGHTLDFSMYWGHVENFVPHNNIYNYGRMENVWLNR
jgi:peptide/nickel transport system substrate-binding protein